MTSYQSDNWGQDIYACSWCGEDDDPPYIEAGGSQDGAVYQVRCPGCGCAGPKRLQAEECARDWNEIATPAPGWVAVGDSWSGDGLAVLVYHPDHGTRVGWRNDYSDNWSVLGCLAPQPVTHWMPLPLPPAPAEREESK